VVRRAPEEHRRREEEHRRREEEHRRREEEEEEEEEHRRRIRAVKILRLHRSLLRSHSNLRKSPGY
jgi:hypothetical protein